MSHPDGQAVLIMSGLQNLSTVLMRFTLRDGSPLGARGERGLNEAFLPNQPAPFYSLKGPPHWIYSR
jgi:hypothetical protein